MWHKVQQNDGRKSKGSPFFSNEYLNKMHLAKLLGVIISNTLWWDAPIDHLIIKCNSYLFLLSRIKVFYLEGIEYCFRTLLPHLDFCCIIGGNCSSTLEDKLVKFQKRTARVILNCDLYTPSSDRVPKLQICIEELFKTLPL